MYSSASNSLLTASNLNFAASSPCNRQTPNFSSITRNRLAGIIETEEVNGRSSDKFTLFGGSPEDVPQVYRDASPITYVDEVRAPVLVLAGDNDPRCPLQQVLNYLDRLGEREVPFEFYRYDAGHGSLVVAETLRQVSAEVHFARRAVGAG